MEHDFQFSHVKDYWICTRCERIVTNEDLQDYGEERYALENCEETAEVSTVVAKVIPMRVHNAKANFNDAASFFQWLASEAATKPELFSHVIVGYAAVTSLPIFLDYSAVGDTSITSALGFLEACKQNVWEQAGKL
jgi:hypothetical protein